MAYTLNTVDITSAYGLIPSHAAGSNIALVGGFDMPKRIGDTSHDWGDSDGLELYTASADLFFGGRDITLETLVTGTRDQIYDQLKAFYGAVSAVTGLSALSTPYGDYSVYPKMADPTHFRDISKLKIEFREPDPDLTGGTIPAASDDLYMIDGVPMSSFGLYASKYDGVIALPDMKDQRFTKVEAEGYEITKRKPGKVDFEGVIIAADLDTFKAHIKNLYALFTKEGERTFSFRNQVDVTGAILDGFKVTRVLIADVVVAVFKCEITVTSMA